uniref:NB-ARC domain-containing protein n=1 Tax=Arundo donax TaxID=35708 RepID=A0A0A8XNX2_ARUDO
MLGKKIVSKLKGFPLAAKTVGRLLRNPLTLEHWTRVLESKEWELQTDENDIMPALKLSYDYPPFHLQQCFYYCALFPEDYEFDGKELVHLWIGLDILQPCDQNRSIEDVGLSNLNDLVDQGFLKKNERAHGCPYYVVHDLLHDLAVNISAIECLSISSTNVKSIQITQHVRHLSIIVDNKDVEDRKSFKNYKNELVALNNRLKVENLRTLMLFGEHHGSFAKTFGDLFEKATALRTIYLFGASYNVEDMLCNFSKLVHLRYLRIKSKYWEDRCLMSALSRLYHLEVIDIQEWKGCSGSTRDISNLVKLRHFLVPKDSLQLHSNVVEVGKMKLLSELRSFETGKEGKGFELSQLGQLSELGGSLSIRNLEKIQAIEEAGEAKLIHKNRLHKLTLEWDATRCNKDATCEENALEILQPHSNLQDLCIRGHGGSNCPKWLGESISVKSLESLHLDDVSWKDFPPLGELWLINEHGEYCQGCIPGQSFSNLKRLELVNISNLKKWAGNCPCDLFSHLEVLIIKDCPELVELPISHHSCFQPKQEINMAWFPRLQSLEILNCLKLVSLPRVPWTSNPCSANIR